MGLRILNGYKICKKDLSAVDLFNLLKEFESKAQESFKDIYNNKVAEFIADFFDYKTIFGVEEANKRIKLKYKYLLEYDDLDISFVDCVISDLIDRDTLSKSPIHTNFDFKYKLLLYPLKDSVLMLVVSTQDSFEKIFGYMDKEGNEIKSKYWDFVTPYYYYSVCDLSDKISKSELEERKNIWNKVLGDKALSLEFNLGVIPSYFNEREISEVLISNYELRINHLSNKIFQDKYINGSEDFSKFLDTTKDLDSYKKSNEFKIKISKIEKELKERLPKTYYTIKKIYT